MTDTDWKLPWEGGCRCDAVRVRVSAPPLVSMACHCTGCQRMSASAFSLSLLLPEQGFEVIRGAPVLGGLKAPEAPHFFCDSCKTWMFTRVSDFGLVNLRPTMLDRHDWIAPFMETWTSEKLPWATTGAVHSFATQPDPEAYEGLMADFAARGCKP